MKTIEEAIYTRLSGDSALATLLTGSGRIHHALEAQQAQKPTLTYLCLLSVPGSINSDRVQTMEETYQFIIFAENYPDIAYRLRVLLDGYRFPETSEAGNIRGVWESDDADMYDDALQVGRKDVRYRILLTPKAVGAV